MRPLCNHCYLVVGWLDTQRRGCVYLTFGRSGRHFPFLVVFDI